MKMPRTRVKNILGHKKPTFWISIVAVMTVLFVTVGFATNQTQEPLPWVDVPQKSDWPTRDMTFDRISFGTDREYILYRMGNEPDSEQILAGERILSYHVPPVIYTPPDGDEPGEVPGSAYDVTFYLKENCVNKETYGVYRIDIAGGNPAGFEMTGRQQGDGTLAGVLAQYGGPNAVEHENDSYILWYYSPINTDKRMWFEVKDGELTSHMGIVCLCDGKDVSANEAVEQLVHSLTYEDGQILFQIPQYDKPYDWNICILSREKPENGFYTSIQGLRDVNESHAWEAGQSYLIPIKDRNLTGLLMDISLPDESGNMIEKSVDLLALTIGEQHATVIPLYTAQLTHDGSTQTIELDTVRSEVEDGHILLRVVDADEKTLWKTEAWSPHAGWNTLFLTHIDGKDYLTQYNPTMYQGNGTYSFRVFSLDKNGNEIILDQDALDFSVNPPGGTTYFRKRDIAPVKAFYEHVNQYLSVSELLLNTDDNIAARLPEDQRARSYGTKDEPIILHNYFYKSADLTLDQQMNAFVRDYIETYGELKD